MKAGTFEFEGQKMTIAQIRELVPILPAQTIRAHLHAGRRTREAMLTFSSAASSSRGGRSAANRARKAGSETLWSGRHRF